jgi:thioredoxin 2
MNMIVQCAACGTKNRIFQLDEGRAVCGKCKTTLPDPGIGEPFVLNDGNFDMLIQGSKMPILVDFWAAWCGPCKMMAPVLHQLAGKHAKIRVAKLDTEAFPKIAAQYGIQSIPTLILFIGGKEAKRISGAMPLPALEAQLSAWL